MDATLEQTVIAILSDALQLDEFAATAHADTALFGALAEFDSMAVVTVLTMLEEEFDIVVHDDEVNAGVFTSVSSLVSFVAAKVAA
ncbi:MAG: acyl carrier protein [Pseudomonadota bacterium]